MKRTSLLLLAVLFSGWASAQDSYYWYKGEKVNLEVQPDKSFVLVDAAKGLDASKAALEQASLKIERVGTENPGKKLTPLGAVNNREENWAVVAGTKGRNLTSLADIRYQAPVFVLPESHNQAAISYLFFVQLKDAQDVAQLQDMANKNGVTILGSNRFMPLWYTLACTKASKGNALELANDFYESGRFASAEPDWVFDNLLGCKNDTHFPSQWGLQNTGQQGTWSGTVVPDIKACNAWTISQGSNNVIISVFDEGMEKNHPDLPNIHPESFDSKNGTSPSVIWGNHGTACAGIIGATLNNSLGVSGVAPNCPLMDVSIDFGSANIYQDLADGMNWSWQNGASVISNSWGGGSPSTMLDNAISNALNQGRNGLGCIVVFLTHNYNGAVVYPSNSNPAILTVGAMSPCGQRKSPSSCDGEAWGSNYGPTLDVMAPGVKIPTTDRQGANGYNTSGDYTLTFNGTSSATPHVSAIAGLILSVNPALTRSQVTNMIESTTQKVGTYSYVTTTGRPNGTWNNEMGYGLVNAYAAVQSAQASCNTGLSDLYMKDRHTDFGTEPNPDPSWEYWNSQDIWVRRQPDGFTNSTHQNAEYRPIIYNVPNYVYVKVRNRGCAPSTVSASNTLKLYWAKAATALGWTSPWDGSLNGGGIEWGNPIGTQLTNAISTGGYNIYEFAWFPPDPGSYASINSEPWHFCLLARLQSSSTYPYGMTYGEGSDLFSNVKNNNNVVWRNITVIDSMPGAGKPDIVRSGCVLVRNMSKENKVTTQLEFSVAPDELDRPLTNFTSVEMGLDQDMLKSWLDGGQKGKNLKYDATSNKLYITQPHALLDNVLMQPFEQHVVCMRLRTTDKPTADQTHYNFSLAQYDDGKIVGGEHFEVVYGNGEKQEGTKRMVLSPYGTAQSLENLQVFPNPATSNLNVEYPGTEVVTIQMSDVLGALVYESQFTQKTSLDVSKMPKGIYILKFTTEAGRQQVSKVVLQ